MRSVEPPPPWRPGSWRTASAHVLVVGVIALVAGGLTSFGQSWLPAQINSVANSASGWTAVIVLLVWASRERALVSAASSGVVGFAALNLGYQIVSTARGFFYTGEFWFAVAAVVGPVVGVAASWLHRRDLLAAIGVSVPAGIGIGEAVNGLLFLPTTSPVYWALSGTAGLILLVCVCSRRLPTAVTRLFAVLATVATAALYQVGILLVF